MRARSRGIGTRAVHPPRPEAQPGEPLAPVLDLASTYRYEDADAFAKASEQKVGAGYVYSRWANPTTDAFEAAVADLEGAPGAEAFPSGMAAIATTLLALCSSGDRVVAARQLYGSTYSLLAKRLPRYGIQTTFCDVGDHDGIRRALQEDGGAKVLYCETIGNPRVPVADLPALSGLAAEAGATLVVDNTFASPVLCRPREHGAGIVVHSATKFLGGHHDLLGGVVCTGEELLTPVRELAIDLGPTLSPFNSWLALRGIATLHLRVERSSASAQMVAEALESRADVDAVYFPALESSPDRTLSQRLLAGSGGSIIGFDVAGGVARAKTFQEKLDLVTPAASLGGTHTLIVHAASVTHTQLDAHALSEAGIAEGFCRLSVGLEDPEDVIEDLFQALDAA
jgi:cystathionine beta-lyase/cystathionine gamma-synthase